MNSNSPHQRRTLTRSIAIVLLGFAFSASIPAFAQQTVTPGNTVNPTATNIVVSGSGNTVNATNQVSVTGDNNTVDALSPLTIVNGFGSNVLFGGIAAMPPGYSNPSGTGGDNILLGNYGTLNGLQSVLIGDNGTLTGGNSIGIGPYVNVFANSATCLGANSTCGSNLPNSTIDPVVVGGQTAVGYEAQAISSYSTSLGMMATSTAQFGMALGYGANAGYYNCIALGSTCDRANSASFGMRQLTQVSNGTQSFDAVNLSQLTPLGYALGGGAGYLPDGSFMGPQYVLSGGTFGDVGSALTYLDNRITNIPTGCGTLCGGNPNSVNYDDGSKSSVTLQGQNGTQIHNVAAGTASTDAANVGQVQQAKSEAIATSESYTDAKTKLQVQYDNDSKTNITLGGVNASGTAVTPAVTLSNVAPGEVSATSTQAINGAQLFQAEQQAHAYTDQAVGEVKNWAKAYTDNKFAQARREANEAGAAGGAIGLMALSASRVGPTYNRLGNLSMAVGGYNGTGAVALGWSQSFQNGKVGLAVAVSKTPSHAFVGASLSIGLGD